jgi:hypothetical protein
LASGVPAARDAARFLVRRVDVAGALSADATATSG